MSGLLGDLFGGILGGNSLGRSQDQSFRDRVKQQDAIQQISTAGAQRTLTAAELNTRWDHFRGVGMGNPYDDTDYSDESKYLL